MTNLGPRKQRWLDAVADAAAHRDTAEAALRQAVADALAHGVPAAHVAAAVGVSRSTLWRWQEAQR